MTPYHDRRQAGRVLGAALSPLQLAGRSDVLVLGLPRGGVPVAYEVARALRAPLDVFVVRKLGLPGHEELAFGAIASGGVRIVDEELVSGLGIPHRTVEAVVAREQRELARREQAFRGDRLPLELAGRTAVLVDDGLATGSTMRAAVAGLRQARPDRIVVAVPIAASSTCRELAAEVDEIVCAATPERFRAVGLWYEDFSQIDDEEVRELLTAARREQLEGRRAGRSASEQAALAAS
jgi:predicted phosphoribosyltransferase